LSNQHESSVRKNIKWQGDKMTFQHDSDSDIEEEMKALVELTRQSKSLSWILYLVSMFVGGGLFFLEFTSLYLAIYGGLVPLLIFYAMDKLEHSIFSNHIVFISMKKHELVSRYEGDPDKLDAVMKVAESLKKQGLM